MKKINFLKLLFILLCMPVFSFKICAEINVGEKLIYNVQMGIFSAGTQIVQVKEKTNVDSKPVYHIISQTKTNSFFSVFYKMDNTVEAFIDEESFSLRKLTKNLHEGDFKQKSTVVLNLESLSAEVTRDGASEIFNVPSFVLDIVSMPYYLRSISLKTGQTILLNILLDNSVKVYEAKVEGKEMLSTAFGRVETFRVVENKEKIRVWITNDSRRLPVKISVGTNFGEIVGVLVKIEKS